MKFFLLYIGMFCIAGCGKTQTFKKKIQGYKSEDQSEVPVDNSKTAEKEEASGEVNEEKIPNIPQEENEEKIPELLEELDAEPDPEPDPELGEEELEENHEVVLDSCGFPHSEDYFLKICNFQANPGDQEFIKIKNYTQKSIALEGYSILDQNLKDRNKPGYLFPEEMVVESGEVLQIEGLSFKINDFKESLFLVDVEQKIIDECIGIKKEGERYISQCLR